MIRTRDKKKLNGFSFKDALIQFLTNIPFKWIIAFMCMSIIQAESVDTPHPSSRFSVWSSPSGILEKASFFSFFFSFLDSVLLKFWITPSFSFSGPFVSVL